MKTYFAGFTYCDGFPFGGEDGIGLLILAGIVIFVAFLAYPQPQVFRKTKYPRGRTVASMILGVLAAVIIFKAFMARSKFHSECAGQELFGTVPDLNDLITPTIVSILIAFLMAVILKLVFLLITQAIRAILKK